MEVTPRPKRLVTAIAIGLGGIVLLIIVSMPDVKPSPRAGAMRLSLTRADQKGIRSASILAVVVACIPDPHIESRR